MRYLYLVLSLSPTWAFTAKAQPAAPSLRYEEPLALTPLRPDKALETSLGIIAVGTSAEGRWQLRHGGQKPIQVESLTIDPPFTVESKACLGTWEANRSCELALKFEPKEAGAHAATLRVQLKGEYEETTVLLRVSGTALRPARIELEGDTNFGNLLLGSMAEKEVVLRNTGEMEATSLSVRVTGAAFQGTSCDPRLSPGKTCAVKLQFQPTTPGAQAGKCTVTYQGGASERSLAGAGLRPASLVMQAPGAGNLGTQILGTTSAFLVAVANVGDLPAENLEVAAPLSSPFSFRGGKFPGEGGDCGKTLAPRLTCRLALQSAPLFGGASEQKFGLRFGSREAWQTLAAEGITPARLSIREKSPGEFPERLVDHVLEERYHVVNEGQGEATNFRITPTGFGKGFELKTAGKDGAACGSSIPAKGECELTVRFTSAKPGSFEAGLTLSYQNGLAEQTYKYPLHAKVLAPARLVFEPVKKVDFGDQVVGSSKAEFITIRNDGDVPTEKLEIQPLTAPFAFKWASEKAGEKDLCGQAVHGGRRCLVQVAYSPTTAGVVTADLKMGYSDGATTQSLVLPLKGRALAPANLEVTDKGAIDFGTALFGAKVDRVLTIKNTGELPAVSLQLGVPIVPNGAFAAIESSCKERVEPGRECTVKTRFAPVEKGAQANDLKVTFADGQKPMVSLAVPLKGVGQPPAALAFREAKMDFGRWLVGQKDERTFEISNSGESPALKLRAQLSSEKTGFVWKGGRYPGEGGTCADQLEAAKSCKLVVTFAPQAAGDLKDTLEVEYDNGVKIMKAAALGTGRAVAPGKLQFSAPNFDFGIRVTGSKAAQIFEMKNTGGETVDLNLEKITLAGAFTYRGGKFPGDSGNCGKSLAPGASCRVELEFSPTENRGYAEKAVVLYSDRVAPEIALELGLKGDSRAPALLSLSPETFAAFGPVFVGDKREGSLKITNRGGVEGQLDLTPAYEGGGFTLSHTCPARLAPGASCQATVKFVPEAAKSYEARVRVKLFDGLANHESELKTAGEGQLVADLHLNRPQLDFGRYPIGKATSRKVKIENRGTVDATALQGTLPAAPFRWQGGAFPGTEGDCVTTLAPGKECTLSLEFLPVAPADADGQVEIRFQDGRSAKSVAVDLKGKGEGPARDIATENNIPEASVKPE